MTTLPILKIPWPPPLEGEPATPKQPVVESPPNDGLIEYDGYWLDVDDYLDLIRPRNIPEPCPCCGLRLRHTPICDELRWRGTLPFGKHKGKQFHLVPESYLRWLFDNRIPLPDELRQEIVDEMAYRRTGSRATPRTNEEFEERLAIMFEDEATIDLEFPPR